MYRASVLAKESLAWGYRSFTNPGQQGVPMSSHVPLIIEGKDVPGASSSPVISPITGEQLWIMAAADAAQADEAVKSAHRAFASWSQTKVATRRNILLKAADIMERRRTELAEYMYQETGADKGYQDAILNLGIDELRDAAGRIAGAVTGTIPEPRLPGMKANTQKKPFGVHLGIAPWNGPYHLGTRAVTLALATGNTVVLKGPELSPRSFWALVDVFREAGLPDGCLNLVFHSPSDAPAIMEQLVAHPLVKINFTGSTRVGRIIAATAGKHLKPVLMELGGKASAIVFADADLDKAVMHCVMGAYSNHGQICMSTERIIVHESIVDKFEAMFGATVRRLFKNQQDTPKLITAAAAQRCRDLIADAISKGARSVPLFDGETAGPVETWMQPVVLRNVDKSMDIYETESFGPIVSFFTFSTEAEAVALANDTAYGLTAAVFTEDLRAGFRVSEALDTAAVHVNSTTVHDEAALPHGGVKDSGFGRFNGEEGMNEFMYTKTVTWME